MHSIRNLLPALCAAAWLAACGGGGGSTGGGTSAPPQQPPPAPGSFAVGGSVNGLNSTGLVLRNNGGDDLAVTANSTQFSFATPVARGGSYAVTVAAQPSSQDCTVTNGSGTTSAAVTDVVVACGPMAPLTVIATDPVDHAIDVDRAQHPTVTFSVPIEDPAAAGGTASLEIAHPGIADRRVAGGAIASGPAQLSLAPDAPLLPLTPYVLKLSSDFKGRRGETMTSAVVRRFTTDDGAWQPTQVASGPDVQSVLEGYTVAVDRLGNALAAWRTRDAQHGISVSRYDAAGGTWSDPHLVTDGSGDVVDPQLAMDSAGNALLVWTQLNVASPRYHVIRSARYDAMTDAWGALRFVSHVDGSNNSDPSVVVQPNGLAGVAWKRSDAANDSIWMAFSSISQDGDWSVPDRVDDPTSPQGRVLGRPAFAWVTTNVSRTAVAWSKRGSNLNQIPAIWARVYDNTPNGNLGSRVVSIADGNPEIQPELVIESGPAADIYLAWHEHGPGDKSPPDFSRIRVARRAADEWGFGAAVSDMQRRAFNLRLATNAAGSGIASTWLTWCEDGPATAVRVARMTDAGPTELSTLAAGDGACSPGNEFRLAVDRMGNASAVWKDVPNSRLMTARYNALINVWSPIARLTADDDVLAGGAFVSGLAVNVNGDMMLVWPETSTQQLRSRQFR